MNIYQQLAKVLNIAEFTENYTYGTDLEIGPWQTADGYDLHVITADAQNLDFEYDVFYYQPSFDDIIARIEEMDKDITVFVSDLEEYLPEYEVEDYIEKHNEKLLEKLIA